MTAGLAVFARAPELGQVKSRLADGVGQQQALQVYRQLLEHTLVVASGSDLVVEMWVAGETAHPEVVTLGKRYGLPLRAQTGTDLGGRMSNALQSMLGRNQAALVIGADCPQLDSALLNTAAQALKTGCDVVLGPAVDGGYYLIGMTRPQPRLFRDVPWGGADVLATTLEIARSYGLNVELLDPLRDVDTAEDLAWAQAQGLII